MTASYTIVVVPLDSRPAASFPATFDIELICTPEFAPGLVSQADINAALDSHPLFSRKERTIAALALPYSIWITSRKPIDASTGGVIQLELGYSGTYDFSTLSGALSAYLKRPGGAPAAPVKHDSWHDQRRAEEFLDVVGMHERITELRQALRKRVGQRLGFTPPRRLDDITDKASSYRRQRWFEGAVQHRLVQLLFNETDAATTDVGPESMATVEALRKDVANLERRLRPSNPGRRYGGLRSFSDSGDTEIAPHDPNAAVHAALINSLLSRRCGFTTSWTATAGQPLVGDYVVCVDAAALGSASANCKMTAVRRSASTHPLSWRDAGQTKTTNCGLSLLNGDDGMPRYLATFVNSEAAVIQATVLQAKNSISNMPTASPDPESQRDDRPPTELSAEQFGLNETEAAGLTISAPVEDIVVPTELADEKRETTLPALYLEDLWIGYRLDLAVGGGKLRSIHRQKQRVRFKTSASLLVGETEDFVPREPLNDSREGTSTEILRFNGLSSSQNIDFARFQGTYDPPPDDPAAPFSVETLSCSGVTPLRFELEYPRRLRNVFQGGISFTDDDPALPGVGSQSPYVQSSTFGRARLYKAGEIVIPAQGRPGDKDQKAATIFLKEGARLRRILVAPAPVDLETARYTGQFLAAQNEPSLHADRAFVVDLPAYLDAEGEDAPYFCDPDVSEIKVEAWMRNGDPGSLERGFWNDEGGYCELIQPLYLGPVTGRFGAGDRWPEFRPVELIIEATSDRRPVLKATSGGRRVRLSVPLYAEIEIVITPVVSVPKLLRSGAFGPGPSPVALADGRSLSSDAPPIPVTEHRLRATYCGKLPSIKPGIVSVDVEQNPAGKPTAILKRDRFKDAAEVVGYIETDAASTGSIQLHGSWSEIDDSPMQGGYSLKQGQCLSRPRSLIFRQVDLPSPAAFMRGLGGKATAPPKARTLWESADLQCAENKLYTGGLKPEGTSEEPSSSCMLALGDCRRKRLAIRAVGTSRHADQFPDDEKENLEKISAPIVAEAPASMILSPPVISHILPLVRSSRPKGRGPNSQRRMYGFRIYVRPPWFLSNIGERLAIACRSGSVTEGPRDTLNKFFTQWGEDPSARMRGGASKSYPRASDFRAAQGQSESLDPNLYPPDCIEGNAPVLYFDNVAGTPGDDGAAELLLSLASFGLHQDREDRLWYCDVEIAREFAGWIGLALYRHQPHAHDGLQLSQTACWAYCMMLHGELISWTRQKDRMHVTVGPVFDRSIGFEADIRRFHDGVSGDLRETDPPRYPFRTFTVGEARYFEGYFPGDRLTIVKRRFEKDIAAFTIGKD